MKDRAAEHLRHQAHAPVRVKGLAVVGDNASAFLTPVLQGVQAVVSQFSRVGMSVNAEDTTIVLWIVLCVHVLYFWDDLGQGLREIARVLKPGGTMALLFRSSEDQRSVQSFPASVYRFRTLREVEAALLDAGFRPVASQSADPKLPNLLIALRAM